VVSRPGDNLYDYLRRSLTQLKRAQTHELEATQGNADGPNTSCTVDQRPLGGYGCLPSRWPYTFMKGRQPFIDRLRVASGFSRGTILMGPGTAD
jgi:hypothetical protein